MNAALKEFLNLVNPPARLTGDQGGWRLGLNRDEMKIVSSEEIIKRLRDGLPTKESLLILSSATRLRPLGNPAKMATKYFSESEIALREQDAAWLDKAIRTIRLYWKEKKTRRKK